MSTGPDFENREGLVALIRWLAIYSKEIPDGDDPPPTPSKTADEWEESFGPATWSLPEDPDTCGWYRFPRQVALVDASGMWVVRSCQLRASEVAGFLSWIRSDIGQFDIVPEQPFAVGL